MHRGGLSLISTLAVLWSVSIEFGMMTLGLYLPFFTSAAAVISLREAVAPSTNSCGGLEYLIRISEMGGSFSSGWIARLLMT